MTNADRAWWNWRLFTWWVVVNSAAFIVIPLIGIALQQVASLATQRLAPDHRTIAVLLVAVAGAAVQGIVLGRWQWRLIRLRIPGLARRGWVRATLVPAFAVWLIVIGPEAVDVMAKGGNTLAVFRNGFVQALVLGPLIGLSQATALRGHTSRWAWWLAANVTAYLSGALLHLVGIGLQDQLTLPQRTPDFFPVPAFAVHGTWMLWITAPSATVHDGRPDP